MRLHFLPRLGRRKTLAVAAFAAFFFIAHAATAEQLTKLSMRLDWLPSGQHAPIFLAEGKGWFKKYGLDVTLYDGTGSAAAVQLVGAGQFDVAQAELSNLAFARSKGVPIISIGGIFRKGDIGMLIPVNSPIHSIKDLKGKTVSYTASSFESPFMDAFLATGGLTRADVTLVNTDASGKTASLLTGQADGVMGSPPSQIPLFAGKKPVRAISFADIGLNLPGYGIVTSEAMLKKEGPALSKLVSVIAGAWTYTLAGHEDEAVAAIVKARPQAKLNPTIIAAQMKLDRAYIFTPSTEKLPIGFQTDSDWTSAIAVMEKAKTIEPGSKPKDYFTNAYLDTKIIKAVAAGP